MAATTVLLAPAGVADGVLGVLADLSAAGLLDPFIWITDPSESAPPRLVTLVERGRARDVTVQQVVTAHNITVIRVCVVVPLLGADPPLTLGQERFTTGLLASSSGTVRKVRVRALLARPGAPMPAGARIAVDGWHNLLIAPEDGPGPGLGHVRLPADTTASEVGRHAAPVLAGALGLWSDLNHAPLDTTPVMPGEVVRLVRSYYRRLETGQAEAKLRRELLSQGGTLPLPNDQRAQVVFVNDQPLAATTMSDALWRKHADVLKGPRRSPAPQPKAERVGLWAALKMFFGFMWAALKNAPSAWYNAMVDSVSKGIASTVNKTVFGSGSAYEVVVNGRTARGDRADWADIGDATSQLSASLAGTDDAAHAARTDLSTLWQDYSRAALTLADAGARSGELPPVQIGVNRGIFRRAADVVPGPRERFTDIPGEVAANIQAGSVDATDPLGAISLRNKLAELERNPEHGLAARSTLNALADWQRRHNSSFGVAVGRRLAEAFAALYDEVQRLLITVANPPPTPPEPDSSTAKLARWIQVMLGLLVVLGGVAGYIGYRGVLAWWWAGSIWLGCAVCGLTAAGIAFSRSQQELFHLLNERRRILDQRRVDEDNLRTALRDLRRLSQAYGEYLAWSRALGAFLAAPLGPDTYRHDDALRVSWGLPQSTSVGYAAPADADIATTVGYLRRDLFSMGWLSSAWEQLVISAQPVPPGSREVSAEGSPLWTQPGRGSGSVLDGWSAAMFDGSTTSTGADDAWRRALANLTGSMSQLVDTLVNRVHDATGATMATSEFLSQIDRAAPPRGTHMFDPCLLTDLAVTSGSASVSEDVRATNQSGVGIVCVATQFSDAVPVDHIVAAASPTLPRWDGVIPAAPREAPGAAPSGRYEPGQAYRAPEAEGFRF
jgi:hypothetical protein